MTDFRVDITPSAGLTRSLTTGHLLGIPVRDFERVWAERIATDAAAHAPRDQGGLQQAHRVELGPGVLPAWATVRVDQPYAQFVHDGTKPHWPPRSAVAGWSERHGIDPFLVQRAIARHGTKPRPWLKAAAERSRSTVGGLIGAFGAALRSRWGH